MEFNSVSPHALAILMFKFIPQKIVIMQHDIFVDESFLRNVICKCKNVLVLRMCQRERERERERERCLITAGVLFLV